MDHGAFVLFGLQHGVAIAATVLACAVLIRVHRSTAVTVRTKRTVNAAMAVVLIVSVLCDPLWAWLRYRVDPAEAITIVVGNSLPLHFCDIVSFILAATLLRPSQRGAEIGYLWGLSGTLQGVLTPTLQHGWSSPEYWTFFLQHGGVPAAALGLVFGAGLTPQRGALLRAMAWGWLYMAATFVFNLFAGTNYGFFNAPPAVPSLLDYMGPWPWYLLTLQAVAALFFVVLLLPFRTARRPVGPVPQP